MKRQIITLLALSSILLIGCKGSSISSNKQESDTSSEQQGRTGQVTIDIYSSNDMHGAVEEEGYKCGIGKAMTFLKEKGDQPNTLLLDQGDTWQGSIYSNYNKGEMFTDIMNYVQFDARTVGNHDFDWGKEYIEINTAKKYNGYATPVLAGNIYDFDFDTKTVGDTQQSDLGVKSVIYTLENEVKVGILGGIGASQIVDISSNFTMDLAFKDEIEFIKDEATHLRNDENCDLVIASIHTGQADLVDNGLENYVDLVLCGHTHRQEYTVDNGLLYVQSYANTQSFGHTTLTYDFDKAEVVKKKVEFISGGDLRNSVTIDSTIQGILNAYNQQTSAVAQKVVANNVVGEFGRENEGPNVMCKAILDCLKKDGYEVDVTYVNKTRSVLPSSSWTMADLYESFPFDNQILIMEISGREFMNEIVKYNWICKNANFTETQIDPDGTYKIGTIDFLCYHTGEDRNYDYFPEHGGQYTLDYGANYRDTLARWLRLEIFDKGRELNASDYDSSLSIFDKSVYHY